MRKIWQQTKSKRAPRGKETGAERKNMRINRKINDAATPSGEQSAEKDTRESIWTHANIQAFSAN